MEPEDTAGWKFFLHHLDYFYKKDVEGLVANDYTADAQVISYDFAVQGTDALKQLFTGYLQMIGDFKVTSWDHFRETADSILVEATMDTERAGERKVWDVFMMKDGKITHHFTGVR